jgi:transposase-like protein
MDVSPPRVVVAADELEEARAIAARPIPQEIINQSRVKVEDYEPPVCPRCGAADPLLQGVDPFNQWLCESCRARWTEAGGKALDPAE